jgi:hypothetical protein
MSCARSIEAPAKLFRLELAVEEAVGNEESIAA